MLDASGCWITSSVQAHCTSPTDLAHVLKRLGTVKPIVLTDGNLFSHDGGIAPFANTS